MGRVLSEKSRKRNCKEGRRRKAVEGWVEGEEGIFEGRCGIRTSLKRHAPSMRVRNTDQSYRRWRVQFSHPSKFLTFCPNFFFLELYFKL